MSSSSPEAIDDLAKCFPGMAPEKADSHRELELVFEQANGERPIYLVEPNEEVGQFRDDVRLSHAATPGENQVPVEEPVGQSVLVSRKVSLGKLGMPNLRE